MNIKIFLKRRWKLLLNIFTIAALVLLAVALRHQLATTLDNLTKVNAWVLLLIIPIEALNYHAQTKMYQGLFASVDENLSYGNLMRASLELNFVNHVFPSGGVSGISYFGFKMRQFGVKGTKATLVQTMKLLLLFVSFEILLLFGMFILAISDRASDLTILIGGGLTMLVLFGTLVFMYVIGSRARIHAFFTGSTKLLNRVIHIVRPKHPETINIAKTRQVFEDFHNDYVLLKSRWRALKAPFWWALMANLTEVLVVYVVYIAFGSFVNLGAVILAYAVANFAGLVSVLPGGVGIYEALMTAVLVAAGVPARLSLPVTVMYRVLNTLLQLPPGYVLYHRTLQGNTLAEAAAEHE
ncbi:MAG TPA: lysylphosphatidylglycerol synthase transmembrane domain-containing protein [Candidatus Saccharimonadales bacterium]|nr:lysylphosphatidylglycerol synthase transmembrane domain-containing protein [Candidatus Saccharimonadales bacterium]